MTKKSNNSLKSHLFYLGFSLVVLAFVWTRGFEFFLTTGNSMSPTLESGDMIVVNKIFYNYTTIDRYDVVVLNDTEDGGYMVKRIIGLPNEVIEIKAGTIYANQKPIKINHEIKPNDLYMPPTKIPPSEYFYIGDNRGITAWGIIEEENIVGKASIK